MQHSLQCIFLPSPSLLPFKFWKGTLLWPKCAPLGVNVSSARMERLCSDEVTFTQPPLLPPSLPMNLIRSARARDPFVADHDHEKCSFGNKGPLSLSLSLSLFPLSLSVLVRAVVRSIGVWGWTLDGALLKIEPVISQIESAKRAAIQTPIPPTRAMTLRPN